jgi:hypothetical protein
VSRTAEWWGSGEGWRGRVWLQTGRFDMLGFAVGGPAGLRRCHGVVTSGAKHGGTEGDTLRRFVQVSGRGGTIWDGKHGFSLTGGQVAAGSNLVSPTGEQAGKRRFEAIRAARISQLASKLQTGFWHSRECPLG